MVQNNTPSSEDHIKNGWQYISRDISVFEASELFIPRSEYMWHLKTWLCNFAFQYMRWLYFGEWLTDFPDDARTNAINHHRDTILFLLVYTMVYSKYHHYNDVIMGAMASQSPTSRLLTQPLIWARAGSKKTSKLRVTGLCGEFTGDRWIPRTNGQ